MKKALVLGGSGTIGHQLCKRLVSDGYWVRCVDRKLNEFEETKCHDFILLDLIKYENVEIAFTIEEKFDLVFALCAEMGGALYVFTGESDAEIIFNSAILNLNIAKVASDVGCGTILFSSSACCYSEKYQMTNESNSLKESMAWDGKPDSVYGIEKLFSEQVYDSFRRNEGLNIRICRFHNVFSTDAVFKGGREKFPSAICRKIAEAKDGDEIEIFGDGKQIRSFLWVEEALDGVMGLIKSDYPYPINIGSDDAISINDLAKMVIEVSGKKLTIKNVPSNAIGVKGRNSDNTLCEEVLEWKPSLPLRYGMEKLYHWVNEQINGII
jgi:nucleoside-diphosphate-sugar epimerase